MLTYYAANTFSATHSSNLKNITFKHIIQQNNGLGTRCEIALAWMWKHLTNEKSTFVQVMNDVMLSQIYIALRRHYATMI